MKTLEEKARAYDERLERAKSEYQTHKSFNGFCEMLTRIFPELKESDYEIKKDIVSAVETYGDFTQGRKEEIYDWLKKQGQVKESEIPLTNTPWSEEDEKNLAQCIEAIDACYKWDSMIDWLKSLRSRSRWKPSEEQMKALDSVIDEYDGYPEFDSLVSLKNDLKKL